MHVTFGTDDPLQFHETNDPLMEEYTIASKYFKLTHTDLCEIARNSVLVSGFDTRCKAAWCGDHYHHPDPTLANDPNKTNLADSRLIFRAETFRRELTMLAGRLKNVPDTQKLPRTASPTQGRTVRLGHVDVDMDVAQR